MVDKYEGSNANKEDKRFQMTAVHNIKYEEFENLTIRILKYLYKKENIHFFRKSITRDDRCDAQTYVVIGGSLPEGLKEILKLWIEIKWRKPGGAQLDKYDMDGHIFKAASEGVDKLIFITNLDFSRSLKDDILAFCRRVGLSCSFINGKRLSKISEQIDKSNLNIDLDSIGRDKEKIKSLPEMDKGLVIAKNRLIVIGQFAKDPYILPFMPLDDEIRVLPDNPVFAVLDVEASGEGESEGKPIELKLELKPTKKCDAGIFSFNSNPIKIFGPDDSYRFLFAIWPKQDSILSFDNFALDINCSEKICCDFQPHGKVKVGRKYLADVELPSQQAVIDEISQIIKNWRMDRQFRFIILKAAAGYGKTYIMGNIRKQIHKIGAKEIILDGSIHNTDFSILKRAVEILFPVPLRLLSACQSGDIKDWLIKNGMHETVSGQFADTICKSGEKLDISSIPTTSFGEILAILLVQSSQKTPIVFLYEDLHNLRPAGLNLLIQVNQFLRSLGRGNVLMISTSRYYYEHNDGNLQKEWISQLEELLEPEVNILLEIKKIGQVDANRLIKGTIPTSEDYQLKKIIEQVGTIPFNIKETIIYLELCGLIERESGESGECQYLIKNVDAFNSLIASRSLVDSTSNRLSSFLQFTKDKWYWLEDFLNMGACVGRVFELKPLLKAIGILDDREVLKAIDELSKWDVLGFFHDDNYLQFDHDLVRRSIFTNLSSSVLKRSCRQAYEALKYTGDEREFARLAFLGDMAEVCLEHCSNYSTESKRNYNYADAIEANYISISVIYPELGSKLYREEKSAAAYLDDAVFWTNVMTYLELPPKEKWSKSLDLIIDSLNCMQKISGGSDRSFENLIYEAQDLVEMLQNKGAHATIVNYTGRMFFERDDIVEAEKKHKEAEELYKRLDSEEFKKDRIDNLCRLFLCHRQKDSMKEAFDVLNHLSQLIRDTSGESLAEYKAKIESYYGYASLYYDLTATRKSWEKAAHIARENGLYDRYAHHIIGVGYIHLLEDNFNMAEKCLKEAESLLENKRGLDVKKVRVYLNLGVLCLLQNRLPESMSYLQQAEQMGIYHYLGRRLWRVEANLATAYECYSKYDNSYSYDFRCLHSIIHREEQEKIFGQKAPWLRQRSILPLINVFLRVEKYPKYQSLLNKFNDNTLNTLQRYCDLIKQKRLSELPSQLGKHCKIVNGSPRMVITE